MRMCLKTLPLILCSLSLMNCGDGHDHKDHSHKDHSHKDHGHHGHDHSGPNPHIWLVPQKAILFVQGAAPKLSALIEASDKKPTIVVTIFPLQSLVEELVGDKATVRTLIDANGSPHGFEIQPHHLKQLSEADALVTVGMNFDDWAEKAMREARGDKQSTVLQFAKLTERDENRKPPGQQLANAGTLITKLDALHKQYESKLSSVKNKKLVTFHNAFDLLAERYGMEVIAHLTEIELSHGGEVPPKQLLAVKNAVTKHELKVIYSEPQFPDRAMQAIREASNVEILRLDPLGNPNVEGYRNYFEMMESNLQTLVKGQSK